jgi:uncharacterized protein YggE
MNPSLYNLKSKNPFLLAILVLAVLWLFVYVTNPVLITVTGNGEASITATNATVSFTLSATDSSSPQTAVLNVNAKALALRTYLKSQGISDNDIAQSQVTAVPSALVTNGASGYQATISMAAKTKQVGTISNLVSGLYSQGALVVGQPILSVDNQDKIDQKAFNLALADARAKVGKIGMSNFKFFKKVIAISQASSPSTSTSSIKPEAVANSPDTLAASNGIFKIVKAVSVTYKMW